METFSCGIKVKTNKRILVIINTSLASNNMNSFYTYTVLYKQLCNIEKEGERNFVKVVSLTFLLSQPNHELSI